MTQPAQEPTGRAPLPLPSDDWRSRWVQFRGGSRLHRVAEAVWDADDEMIAGHVVAVCGRRGRAVMPGILSRMGAARCPDCCKLLGIPKGDGAPRNALQGDMADA